MEEKDIKSKESHEIKENISLSSEIKEKSEESISIN